MSDDPVASRARPARDAGDWLALAIVVGVTLAAYGPMAYSVIVLSSRTTQAVNAFVLLGMAAIEAAASARREAPAHFSVTSHGILLFSASCLALIAGSATNLWPLAVLGLCLNLAALLSFGFGPAGVRRFYPALTGLGCAIILMTFVPHYDRVLRLVAADGSAWLLNLAGYHTQVALRAEPFGATLVVERGVSLFDVATECNGFGIILSSVVLAVILAWRAACPWWFRALLAMASVGVGLAFNVLRIVAISLVSMNTMIKYSLIHEGLGTLIYTAALWAVWGLVRLGRRGPRVSVSQP